MLKNLLRNKKGDIPITILVIGVLAICVLAIFSFYISNQKVKNNFNAVDIMDEVLIIEEKISLYEELGFTLEEIKEIFQIKPDVLGKYIEITLGTVSVKYYLP